MEVYRQNGIRKIVAELDLLNNTDINIFVFDLGLAHFNALSRFETDSGMRASLRQGFNDQPASHQKGDQWNYPDDGGAYLFADLWA